MRNLTQEFLVSWRDKGLKTSPFYKLLFLYLFVLQVIVGLIMNIHSSIRTQFPPSVSPTYIFSHHLLAKVVKRVIGFRATDNNKKNTKLLDSKVLCKFDFDLYFSRNQGFIDKRYLFIFQFQVEVEYTFLTSSLRFHGILVSHKTLKELFKIEYLGLGNKFYDEKVIQKLHIIDGYVFIKGFFYYIWLKI